SVRKGAVIIIPVRGSTASLNKTIDRLKDSLGIGPEEISVLKTPTSNLKSPLPAAPQPSRLAVFGKYRTAMLAGMAVISLLFLMFAISARNKTESIAQAKEAPTPEAPNPSPTPAPVEPTPEPTLEPTPEPTLEPTPQPAQMSLTQQSSTPIRQTI